MLDPSLLLPLFAILAAPVASQVLTTHWANPPDAGQPLQFASNQVFPLRSHVQLQWTTFMSEYSVWVWQQNLTATAANAGNPIFTKTAAQSEAGGTTWIVDSQTFDLNQSNVFFFALGPNITLTGAKKKTLDLNQSNVFFFALGPNITLTGAFTSHYFNLTNIQPTTTAAPIQSTTTTTSAQSTTIATTTRSTSAVSSTQSTTTVATPQGTTTSSLLVTSSLSTTSSAPVAAQTHQSTSSAIDTIGLRVGLGVGIPVVLIIIALLVLRALKKRKQARQPQPQTPMMTPKWDGKSWNRLGKAELPSDSQIKSSKGFDQAVTMPYELPAGR